MLSRSAAVSHLFRRSPAGFFAVYTAIALCGCGKPKPVPAVTTSTPEPPLPREWNPASFDVCGLITKEEVGAIQHAEIVDTKSVRGADGTLRIFQCTYLSGGGTQEVALSVAVNEPSNSAHKILKEYWDETFSSAAERDEPGEREEEEEGKRVPPRAVEGVDGEAAWARGTLAVFHEEKILRISVRGPDEEAVRLDKAKALAKKALPRLSEAAGNE